MLEVRRLITKRTPQEGDAVYVVGGPNAGRNGTAIRSCGSHDRPGVDVQYGAGGGDVARCSGHDVASSIIQATQEIAEPLLEHEVALLVDAADPDVRLVLADSLEGRGFVGLAMAWRGPVPRPAPPDTSSWLTRREATDVLGCSPGILVRLEKRGLLHPRRVSRPNSRGIVRRLTAYDPGELVRLTPAQVREHRL